MSTPILVSFASKPTLGIVAGPITWPKTGAEAKALAARLNAAEAAKRQREETVRAADRDELARRTKAVCGLPCFTKPPAAKKAGSLTAAEIFAARRDATLTASSHRGGGR